MQTLAGYKIKQHRLGCDPRMSRADFAHLIGAESHSTVQGWEEAGKRPRDPRIITRIAELDIATHADWYQTAPSVANA